MFENKVAIVTGGSSGIGRACAIAFAREKVKVVVASRRIEQGERITKFASGHEHVPQGNSRSDLYLYVTIFTLKLVAKKLATG